MAVPGLGAAKVEVGLPGRGHAVHVGSGWLAGDGVAVLRPFVEGRICLLVSDGRVGPLYGGAAAKLLALAGARAVGETRFPAGEASKSLETVAGLYRECARADLDRDGVVVALGGGVVGDVAGFAAATWLRGVALVQLPTSLIAMVDSAVGGKNGVNLPEGKNLVGSFTQPRCVLADLDCLRSLPERELRSGLAEVVKYGVALDADFLAFLEARAEALLARDPVALRAAVVRCCELKAEVVVEDELDRGGRRSLLNLGHSFGHGLEVLGGFAGPTHGEAVAIGMLMAADLALERASDPRELRDRLEVLLTSLGLPTRAEGIQPRELLQAMGSDKKRRAGGLRLVLPVAPGRAELVEGIAEEQILRAIRGRCAP